MIRPLLLAGLLALALPTGARAAEETPKHGPFTKAAIACADKTDNHAGVLNCWRGQITKALKKLDQEDKAFLATLDPDKRQYVITAQKLWQKSMIADCALNRQLNEGNMWLEATDGCILSEVEKRFGMLAGTIQP